MAEKKIEKKTEKKKDEGHPDHDVDPGLKG